MDNWVVCEECNQRQRVTYLWLTCVFCAETLKEHPYFGRNDGKVDGQAKKEVEENIFRYP